MLDPTPEPAIGRAPKGDDTKKFELSTTNDFERARRNFLFATSVLFILGVGDPDKVEIPGFAGTGSIHAPLALAFVLMACVVLLWEYRVEYRTTEARNSSIFAGKSKEPIDVAVAEFEERTQAQLAELIELTKHLSTELERQAADPIPAEPDLGDFDEVMREPLDNIQRFAAHALSNDDPNYFIPGMPYQVAEFRNTLASNSRKQVSDAIAKLTDMTERWETHIRIASKFDSSIQAISSRQTRLLERVSSVSQDVNGWQSRAFRMKDLFLTMAFFGVASGIALARICARLRKEIPEMIEFVWIAGFVGGLAALIVAHFQSASDETRWKPWLRSMRLRRLLGYTHKEHLKESL